jgi:hypothetical protein
MAEEMRRVRRRAEANEKTAAAAANTATTATVAVAVATETNENTAAAAAATAEKEADGGAKSDVKSGVVNADDVDLDSANANQITFSPSDGNVVFASAWDGWAFGIADFAKAMSKKLGMSKKVLQKVLWGDCKLCVCVFCYNSKDTNVERTTLTSALLSQTTNDETEYYNSKTKTVSRTILTLAVLNTHINQRNRLLQLEDEDG